MTGIDIEAIAWAYRKLLAFGVANTSMDNALMMDRLNLMLLQADDGPGEEDGPWAKGWEERSGSKVPAGYTAEELERDNPFNGWLHEGDAPDERDE